MHTNRIEDYWKNAKAHFKRVSVTQLSQFEGHLAVVMWRSEAKGDVYAKFFDLVRSVYTPAAAEEYYYTTALFELRSVEEADTFTPSNIAILSYKYKDHRHSV